MSVRPQENSSVNDGGRRHHRAFELILSQLLELFAGLDHGAFAFVAKEINPAFGQWRRREVSLVHALLPVRVTHSGHRHTSRGRHPKSSKVHFRALPVMT